MGATIQTKYLTILGKLPRKRKESKIEIVISETDNPQARARELIAQHGMRDARAWTQYYSTSEGSEYTDSNGERVSMRFRSLFPSTDAEYINL